MGCDVEATFRGLGPLLIREQRVTERGRLAEESLMAWCVDHRGERT